MIIHNLDIRDIDNRWKEYGSIQIESNKQIVEIAEQKTGYGVKHFLICPRCSNRREKIYQIDYKYTYCRSCMPINIYRGIQNNTKGGEAELHYRMIKTAKEYRIKDREFPFDYMDLIFSRPKYMRHKKWIEGIRKLQALENMRFQNILYKNKYDSKTIDHVFKNRLYTYNLIEMRDNFIDWYS